MDMQILSEPLSKHRSWKGKIEVVARAALNDAHDLAVAYTPGVAEPCLEIQKHPEDSYTYTRRGNLVAVITDGSAVLGLGNIGPLAAMPVMEGKCALFKKFADVDAFPLCVNSLDVDEIVRTISLISGSFGGINLEDIAAPRCFEIERRLQELCDIPIFHDDQHGTAIVTCAALINACRLTNRSLADCKVVCSGAGAAGLAIVRLMQALGVQQCIVCDRKGIISSAREDLNEEKQRIAATTNPEQRSGTLADALVGADVFVGVSSAGILNAEMIRTMAADPLIFAMANPIPEIMPDEALAAGAKVAATGRSDFPNQINNVLAFPGIFRGALDSRAKRITPEMCKAAVYALAELVSDDELSSDYVIPHAFDERVAPAVAQAVAACVAHND